MTRAARTPVMNEPDSYFKLVRKFPLRPIRSEAEYDAAVAVLEKLAVRGELSLDPGEFDYLDALSTFISHYADASFPIPDDRRPPHERLAALIREHEMKHADLARLLGISRPLATLLINGKRELQRAHLYKLAERFKLEPAYFL